MLCLSIRYNVVYVLSVWTVHQMTEYYGALSVWTVWQGTQWLDYPETAHTRS